MFRQLRLIGLLARKDIKLFLADRRAAILAFAVPIVLASAFGLIFDQTGKRLGDCKLPLIVVVEDDSLLTRQVVDDLRRCEQVVVHFADRAAASRELDRRAGGIILILPAGFGRVAPGHAADGARPVVEMRHHPLSAPECRWAEGVLTEVVMRRLARGWLAPLSLSEQADADRPFAVDRQPLLADGRHPFNSLSHSFSGMSLQYLLFWGMECGLLLLRERRNGTWGRTRVGPVPLTTILLGRAGSTTLIALLQVAATFGFGYLVFGVTINGSVAGFLLLATAVSLLAAGIGLLVASIGRTEASARSLFIVVILAVSMLGGLWLPGFLLPKWVQEWSLALPTSWAMRGLDGVTWQGLGLKAVWPSLLAVNLFAFTALGWAMVRFHWSEMRLRRGGIA
jgi:ABC-2 type transport system permease protein